VSWRLAVESICRLKGLTLVEHGFLGRGSRGVAFTVQKAIDSASEENTSVEPAAASFALKVVVGRKNCGELHKEYDIIQAHTKSARDKLVNLPIVSLVSLPPEEAVFVIENIFADYPSRIANDAIPAAAYLMQTVGKRAKWETKWQRKLIIDALYCLHIHGIVHGDPRPANIIEVEDGKLMWIDFMGSYTASSSMQYKQDMTFLFMSMYNLVEGTLSNVLLRSVDAYAKKMTDETVTQLWNVLEEMKVNSNITM